MKLLHRGLSIELAEDDARVAVIETLLFGRPLPPPLPMPKFAAPPADVPPAFLNFWQALSPLERKELALLAEQNRTPAELEALLGIPQPRLMGKHSAIGKRAKNRGLGAIIKARGRGRAARRFYLPVDIARFVKAMVESSGG